MHPEVERELAHVCVPAVPAQRDVVRTHALARLGRARVIACMANHVNEEYLAASGGLRVVGAILKGYDNIKVATGTRRPAGLAR